ncbi:MAG: ABC transporter ATP-binding protein [Lachnospiraceae bacterium]|nr:ABC transporter ATP-binding protein [Lachnospiraceae bacterium]
MNILTIQDVSKRFGSRQILDGLSFNVPEKSVFGFIGQNGAGKTTTMKMVLGLYEPDAGEIRVKDEKVTYGQNKTNRYIGYLPDVPEFYNYMTPTEYLKLCADVTGTSAEQAKKRIPDMLDMVGLSKDNKRIQGFSRGMKQRLGIAQALLSSPELLICDEPTSALDPVGRKEILDILSAVKNETTVIFSTHILSDVERICDKIAFLHAGKIALTGTLEEVKNVRGGAGLEIDFCCPEDAERFGTICEDAKFLSGSKLLYEKRTEQDMKAMMRILVEQDISIQRMEMLEPNLEDLFMEVVNQ